MYKLWMSIYKEIILLKRDFGGLVILFVMPLVLIITITLIQNEAFKTVSDTKIPVLVVDLDHGTIAENIIQSLGKSGALEVVTQNEGIELNEEKAKELVFQGKYQLAIIVPEKLSNDLQTKVNQNVEKIMSSFGVAEASQKQTQKNISSKEIKLYFDPASQLSFKSNIKNAIDKMVATIENKTIYTSFQEQIGETDEPIFEQKNFITYKEIIPKINNKEIIPNSVQHNVPAWTLFAIFFIVVPLSINIVKEKSQGTFIRLITNPVSYSTVLLGKTITYLIICVIQFWLMMLIGLYLFPYLNLPQLDISGRFLLMNLVTICAGLAAIGFGILLGTIATTQEQSAPFGATSVVILAAIGGVWVPVFAMPKIMQYVSHISPMNWGLNAFYDVLLRNTGLLSILPNLILLILFFVLTVTIAIVYDKKKRAV
ncbi:ABC transporter permease [Flavobacterium columnare]|uniref:ABC transporter permease n=1 Tax=Flavobacterium columnare TaxID=996 RepID=UPI001785EDA6|nr:ABC transporter permease [Flavobacterium columnare]QOG89360.1 ABC transporter permease [Flavobacterium columnare]QOG92020.1 ABC transporter permease [Flavobacterium columnare]QOG94684.1 ABC transporter permease [Flavobacterium columnare]QOG97343.1 ABC transporter permease [Flavobacterium columnare]QOH00002.1 ABC transporter permease [Flavobacterium columnare]